MFLYLCFLAKCTVYSSKEPIQEVDPKLCKPSGHSHPYRAGTRRTGHKGHSLGGVGVFPVQIDVNQARPLSLASGFWGKWEKSNRFLSGESSFSTIGYMSSCLYSTRRGGGRGLAMIPLIQSFSFSVIKYGLPHTSHKASDTKPRASLGPNSRRSSCGKGGPFWFFLRVPVSSFFLPQI